MILTPPSSDGIFARIKDLSDPRGDVPGTPSSFPEAVTPIVSVISVGDGDDVARRRSAVCLAHVRQDDAGRFLGCETPVSEWEAPFITIDDAINERNGLKMNKLVSRLSNG